VCGWGVTIGASSVVGFTGEQHHASTGNTFLRSRYAAPSLDRFLSADTVQPNALGTHSYTRYAHAANNPARWTDPSGHSVGDLAALQAPVHQDMP
jgi:RHS repeat-associated protein